MVFNGNGDTGVFVATTVSKFCDACASTLTNMHHFSVGTSVSLSTRPSVNLSVRLSVRFFGLSVRTCVCRSVLPFVCASVFNVIVCRNMCQTNSLNTRVCLREVFIFAVGVKIGTTDFWRSHRKRVRIERFQGFKLHVCRHRCQRVMTSMDWVFYRCYDRLGKTNTLHIFTCWLLDRVHKYSLKMSCLTYVFFKYL